ncbi:MAG: hypothetical protein AABZ17_00680 [Nitrospirota bacterium]
MKRGSRKAGDELRPEYRRSDFGMLVGGKYAARVARETNVVVLEPELAEAFPNAKAVNEALQGLLDVAATTARLTSCSTGRAKQQRAG